MWGLGLWLDNFTRNLNMSVIAYGEIKCNYVKINMVEISTHHTNWTASLLISGT